MFAFVIWDTPDRDGVRRPRPVRHQAAALPARPPTAVWSSLGEEGAAAALLGGSKAAGGVDTAPPVALPDAAVRAGAGAPCTAASAGSERRDASPAPGRRADTDALVPARRSGPTPVRRARAGAVRRDRGRRCARASAMHMRADVPVGAFLSSGIDSTAVVALAREFNPDILTFTVGFDVRRLLRDRRRRRSRPGDLGVDHDPRQDRAAGDRWTPCRRSSGTSTTRSPTRRSCRSTSWPGRPPSTSRSCSPARAPTSSSAATRSTASRSRWRAVERPAARPLQARAAAVAGLMPEGDARQELPASAATTPLEERYYGNARIFTEDGAGAAAAAATTRTCAQRRHRGALRQTRDAGYDDVTAMQYVDLLHLAARRHPGQGRPDDDGALAGAAGAVPGPRGVRAGQQLPLEHAGAAAAATRPSTRCARRWSRSCRRRS